MTPLVDFGSYQTDYVKSAHRLGVPVGFVPFSWDNLTNRGLVRVAPDRVLVWNEHQKRESDRAARRLADRVVVTGAPRFDDFFAMRPSMSREEFCAGLGLIRSPPAPVPVLVGLRRPTRSGVRPALDRTLRRTARPGPRAAAGCWSGRIRPTRSSGRRSISSVCPNVAVWMDQAHHECGPGAVRLALPFDGGRRPQHQRDDRGGHRRQARSTRSQTEEFAGGQEKTLHFHYLLRDNGGTRLEEADSFDEHAGSWPLRSPHPRLARTHPPLRRAFVRPRGLEQPVTPIMADEIERLAQIRKRPRRPPSWHGPARLALLALLKRRAPRAGGRGYVGSAPDSGRLKPAPTYVNPRRGGIS